MIMENCGNLQIYYSTGLDISLYSFGISQVNGFEPYLWGGETIAQPNGQTYKKFTGLSTGNYRWFVKRLTDNLIVKSDYSQVVCTSVGISKDEIEELKGSKLSTAKGAELAGIIQNEVYFSILKTLKTQVDYGFYSEHQIDTGFTTGLILHTEKEVIKIFSNLGVILTGGEALTGNTYAEANVINSENLDYILVKSEPKKILFNPLVFEEITGFQFFCKEQKYKDYSIEQFLSSEQNGGFGNDNNDSIQIIEDYILSLQD